MIAEEQKSLAWLSSMLDVLRAECPWDKAQTASSLRYLSIEEVYELSESILAQDPKEECKELGDLFMHILFYSKIAEDRGEFALTDVIDGICRKLISRHPHLSLPDREGVRQPALTSEAPRWEKIKMKEGRRSVLEGVPASLPPLVKTVRMLQKVAGVGYDYPASSKIEIAEDCTEEEFGRQLISLIAWADRHGINADDALSKAINRFQKEFQEQESASSSDK